MTYDEAFRAMMAARDTVSNGDQAVRHIAAFISGRLRLANVSHRTLCDLKKELQEYNMHTGKWSGE